MSEMEENAFRLVYQFYAKWRENPMQTQEQWYQFARDVDRVHRELDADHNHNILGWRLLLAVLDHFNDLYMNGMIPMPAGYFGRDDL